MVQSKYNILTFLTNKKTLSCSLQIFQKLPFLAIFTIKETKPFLFITRTSRKLKGHTGASGCDCWSRKNKLEDLVLILNCMSKGPWQLLFFKSFLGFFSFFFFIFNTQILLTIHILANGLGNHLHTQINTLFNKTDYMDDLGHHSYNQKTSLIIQETLFVNNHYTILRHKFTKKFIQKVFFTKPKSVYS